MSYVATGWSAVCERCHAHYGDTFNTAGEAAALDSEAGGHCADCSDLLAGSDTDECTCLPHLCFGDSGDATTCRASDALDPERPCIKDPDRSPR